MSVSPQPASRDLAEPSVVKDCVWCGSPLDERADRLPGRTRCPHCHVATTDPWPTPGELDAAYHGWYRPEEGRFSGLGDALLRRSRGRLASRLDRIAPPGRVLDVGAGDGALLDALRAEGREAVGLERRPSRPDVLDRGVLDVDGEWAGIVFWHSLEHLPTPGAALDHAARMLLPGGVLVVAIPNAASLQARVFTDRWFALDLPRHLAHLPAEALTRRLGDLGLTVERASHLRGGQVVFGWLHGLVGTLPGRPDLYDAIRRPSARRRRLSPAARTAYLAVGAGLLPVAACCAAAEVAARRGGTVYVEARRS